MNIYLITAPTSGYDVYDSAVVAAKSSQAARRIHPDGMTTVGEEDYKWTSWVTSPRKVTAEYLGKAAAGTESGVICASFNAG